VLAPPQPTPGGVFGVKTQIGLSDRRWRRLRRRFFLESIVFGDMHLWSIRSGAVLLSLLLLKVELPRRNVHRRRRLQGGTFLRASQVLPPTCRLLGAQGLLVR
jgi:hypothetical protein